MQDGRLGRVAVFRVAHRHDEVPRGHRQRAGDLAVVRVRVDEAEVVQ